MAAQRRTGADQAQHRGRSNSMRQLKPLLPPRAHRLPPAAWSLPPLPASEPRVTWRRDGNDNDQNSSTLPHGRVRNRGGHGCRLCREAEGGSQLLRRGGSRHRVGSPVRLGGRTGAGSRRVAGGLRSQAGGLAPCLLPGLPQPRVREPGLCPRAAGRRRARAAGSRRILVPGGGPMLVRREGDSDRHRGCGPAAAVAVASRPRSRALRHARR